MNAPDPLPNESLEDYADRVDSHYQMLANTILETVHVTFIIGGRLAKQTYEPDPVKAVVMRKILDNRAQYRTLLEEYRALCGCAPTSIAPPDNQSAGA